MINYIQTISYFHPTYQVSCNGTPNYNSINWNGETIIDQVTLDAEWFLLYKINHLTALSEQAEAEIVSGFISEALGTDQVYKYDSQPEDQLNLLGSAAAGDDTYYAVYINDLKDYMLHTTAQLTQIIQDGRDVKLMILQTFNDKKALVLAATTEAEVDAIVW